MTDTLRFGLAVLVAASAIMTAVLANRLSERIRVPAPVLFLTAAAVVGELVPSLGAVSVVTVQRVVTVALIPILFDGGMHLGWRRLRAAAGAVAWIGVAGTVATAAAVAAAAHLLFGFDTRLALMLGTALAPTDPAVVFSVLGRREIAGRSATVIEGESGANDPVGVALMISLLVGVGATGTHAVTAGVTEFAVQMAVGAAVGLVGGRLLLEVMRRVALPGAGLYLVRTVAGAGMIYGAATVAHGSGFLAVFLAGIMIGDAAAPYKAEIRRFQSALASLGEIVAFTMLGLTIDLGALGHHGVWLTGLALAVLLALVIRPVLVGLLATPIRLTRGERVFVLWAGLRGAVPILLGTYIITSGTPGTPAAPGALRAYGVIFVVVAFSVVVQGGSVPAVAARCGVPVVAVEPHPWTLGLRLRQEPTGTHRLRVAPGSPADGAPVARMPREAWISIISRQGALVRVHDDSVMRAGDEVLVLTDQDADDHESIRAFFELPISIDEPEGHVVERDRSRSAGTPAPPRVAPGPDARDGEIAPDFHPLDESGGMSATGGGSTNATDREHSRE